MTFDDAPERVFRNPTRQILAMGLVLVLVLIAGLLLAPQIATVFQANIYLNAVIGGVCVFGIVATFWQVAQVRLANAWLRSLHSGFKGHEFTEPPRLVASMAPMLREGRMNKRLATSTTRTILDSVALRLDEAREITRYIATLLVLLGLLGTFWGLSNTVPAVVDTIRSLAPQEGASSEVSVFDNLMRGLEDQLGGMGTAFASSLLGLAGSLVVGLLGLFAGHGQNRFYRGLEEWLSTHTRIGMISEGEGAEGALIALLERVDEGLERTTSFAEEAEQARMSAETRLAAAADVIARMATGFEQDRAGMADLLGEMRGMRSDAHAREDTASGRTDDLVSELRALRSEADARERSTLDALRAIAGGQAQMAESQTLMAEVQTGMAAVQEQMAETQTATTGMLERATARPSPMMTAETRTQIREIERHLRDLTVEIATARKASTEALRSDLHQLIALIDERTGGPEG